MTKIEIVFIKLSAPYNFDMVGSFENFEKELSRRMTANYPTSIHYVTTEHMLIAILEHTYDSPEATSTQLETDALSHTSDTTQDETQTD